MHLRSPAQTPRRRRSDHEPQPGWRIALRLAAGVALLDWSTKALVNRWIPLDGFVEVWPDRLALWHVRNPAMMLGLWGDHPLAARRVIAAGAALLIALALLGVVQRSHRLERGHRRWAWVFAGLMLGGMAGNLGERAVHWGVTDYLSLGVGGVWLPPGNVADLAMFLAIPLALPVALFELRARARRGTGGTRHADSRNTPAGPRYGGSVEEAPGTGITLGIG
jgi:lipoprotein signal peptidase